MSNWQSSLENKHSPSWQFQVYVLMWGLSVGVHTMENVCMYKYV